MKKIKVLGSGCANCVKTAEFIQKIAEKNNVPIEMVKETNPEAIMRYGVMSTPAVVMDDQLVHSGSIPDSAQIEAWLAIKKDT
uniref:Small redox-active disulfide protein 2 n=1 Tax=Candidatus Kentrum sp. DK TaxID=2126562 RepID=A0A450T6E2_9GAMM|nr:MAG: small redox-active disulfide protein 2 [Candidatus Kentron sp. DK]